MELRGSRIQTQRVQAAERQRAQTRTQRAQTRTRQTQRAQAAEPQA